MKYFLSITLAFSLCLCFAVAQDVIFPFKTSIDVSCPGSESKTYQRIGSKYYYIGKSKVSWFESLHLCRQFGGDLALIESAEELSTLSSYLMEERHTNEWLWISGNSLIRPRHFMSTTNGLQLSFTSWSAGQPDLPGSERCMHLWLRDGDFKMNNWVCTGKAYYICQIQNDTRCTCDN